jgi:6-phosphogluconolactonase (cycloisomerase 2 family)
VLRTYFYTASAVTGDVDAYRLHPGPDETETPRLERTATARAGENLSAIVADPDRRRLYVADRTRPAIVTFAVDPDRGALTELAVTPTSSPVVNLCLSRDRRFMYGVSYVDGTVCAHPVDADADATVTPATAASLSLGPDAHCPATRPSQPGS